MALSMACVGDDANVLILGVVSKQDFRLNVEKQSIWVKKAKFQSHVFMPENNTTPVET